MSSTTQITGGILPANSSVTDINCSAPVSGEDVHNGSALMSINLILLKDMLKPTILQLVQTESRTDAYKVDARSAETETSLHGKRGLHIKHTVELTDTNM